MQAAATKAIAGHGGGRSRAADARRRMKGAARARSNAILEFVDYDTALRYYHSQRHQIAKAMRADAAQIEMVLVEGV